MAGTTRSKTTKAAAKPAASTAHNHKDLEAKIAELEAKLASLTEQLEKQVASATQAHADLKAYCDACCATGGGAGADTELRSELRKYFRTVGNNKIDTHIPKL
jgi:multidrug resistance efflux pump